MIYTCAEAAKVLRKLNEDLKVLRAKEVKGYRFTAAVDEDLESARPVYDYLQTQEEQRRIEARIRKVKHAINSFNISTVIPEFGMTVDEMLVYYDLKKAADDLTAVSDELARAQTALDVINNSGQLEINF